MLEVWVFLYNTMSMGTPQLTYGDDASHDVNVMYANK